MADPICHAAQGGLILLAPFIARLRRQFPVWVIAIVGGILGVLPDVIGAFGLFLLGDEGRLYEQAHSGAIKEVIQYIPMTWLHLFLDSFMHDPYFTWNDLNVRGTLAVLLWLVNIGVIVWFVRIYRRNNKASRSRGKAQRRQYASTIDPLRRARQDT
jgi:hypothetical protein